MRRWDGGERPDLYTAEVWNLRLRKILVRLEERSTLRVEYVPKLRWGSGGAGVGVGGDGGECACVENLTWDSAGVDSLRCFVPCCALKVWRGGVWGGVDESDAAFGRVDAKFTYCGHHGGLI